MISIIIPTKGNSIMLKELIDSIFKSTLKNYEIIIVTNKDDVNFKKVKVVYNKQFKGYSHALNLGANNALGKYLFFLNDDILFFEDSLEKIYNDAVNYGNENLYAPVLLNSNLSLQDSVFLTFFSNTIFKLFHYRISYYLIRLLNLFIYPLNFKLTMWGLTNVKPKFKTKYKHCMGAAIFVSFSTYIKAGKFDEKIFLTLEDQLFCSKILKLGGKIIYSKDCKLIHHGNQTVSTLKKFDSILSNSIEYFKKHI